jgi:glucosamine-6-phosphate deaminase
LEINNVLLVETFQPGHHHPGGRRSEMEVIVKDSYEEMSNLAARMIADLIRRKPRCVLGLATGSTPIGTYKELIQLHQEEDLDFSAVETFNLDEYVGLPPEHEQSYHYFMREEFFRHINIRMQNTHLLDGLAEDLAGECQKFEEMIREAGGIDIQLLGIGANGHIAFNEPGSSLGSRTRIKTLDERTIRDNARFFESSDRVPRYALTMGIGTIMDSRRLILLASDKAKTDAVLKTVEGPITAMVPATIVQLHPKATIITDKAAARKLTRKYPGAPRTLDLDSRLGLEKP